MKRVLRRKALPGLALCMTSIIARAQHSADNVVVAADEAFGLTVGTETLGIYTPVQVRGFNPQAAGNARVGGLYFNQQQGALTGRVLEGSSIKVGSSALGYPFPAPTGIVDFDLRHVSEQRTGTMVAYAGPFQARAVDLDGQIPLSAGTLYLPIGASYRVDAPVDGLLARWAGVGLTPLWKVNTRLTMRLIVDRLQVTQSRNLPTIFMQGSSVPARIRPRYFGENWAQDEYQYRTLGAILIADLSPRWTFRGGLFQSLYANPIAYSEFYLDTLQSGLGHHSVVGTAGQRQATVSGELRLSGHFSEGSRRHELVLCARGYQSSSRYGGSDEHSLGIKYIDQADAASRPDFTHTALTHDQTHLWTAGIAYQGQWPRYGQLAVGLAKARYVKATSQIDAPPARSHDDPWRAYGNLSLRVASRLSVYFGLAQGFEDSGVAPTNAANRGAILPASLTWQRDAGLRYQPVSGVTVTGGAFEVSKPYFNTDLDNDYVQLGRQSHRGLEFSIAGPLTADMNVVAGGVLLHPEVSASSPAATPTGRSAVGLPHQQIQVGVNYKVPAWTALSVDAVLTRYGWSAASIDNRARIPGHTSLDLGLHRQFAIQHCPASLRLQVLNVTDTFSWAVSDSGGFTPQASRAIQAYITIDLMESGSK